MRSSGSTPSLPEPAVRLGIVLVGDDHPRACTGRRLLRLGLARSCPSSLTGTVRPVLLDPYAGRPLTAADRPAAEAGGIVAVDCSWNRLSAEHARHPGHGVPARGGLGRRLPILLAANPQHFGRAGELNTAEALAAALYVVGHGDAAARLLDGFAGGRAFIAMNRERLEAYAAAETVEELVRVERTLFGGGRPVAASGRRRSAP